MSKQKSAYDSLSDEELMEAIIRKDERAFITLYDRYSGRMVNYFYTMMRRDVEKAQDMMQDLFSKIADKPEQFNLERNFKTWFYSIANNMCKNEYRAQEVRSRVHSDIKSGAEISEFSQKANQIDAGIFKQKLEEALAEIDELKRETFLLRYQEDMSIKEISEVHACSEGTVKSRLFYTLKELNARLKVYEHLAGSWISAIVLYFLK